MDIELAKILNLSSGIPNETLKRLCNSRKVNKSYLISCLDPETTLYSLSLCEAIKNDDYQAAKIALRNAYWDLDLWTSYKEKEKKRTEIKITRVGNTTIPCKKCKVQNVNCLLVQKRAADEGMTQCFECFNCGEKWQRN
jgi:DNA-directed RNA polymerase subunit M/transcription elongation factor TFIIS